MNYQVLIVTYGPVAALFKERYNKTTQRSEHREDRQLLGLFPNFFHNVNSKKSPEEREMKRSYFPEYQMTLKEEKNLKRSRFAEEQAPGQPGSSR